MKRRLATTAAAACLAVGWTTTLPAQDRTVPAPRKVPLPLPTPTPQGPVIVQPRREIPVEDRRQALLCGADQNLSFERGYLCWTREGDAFGDLPFRGGSIAASRARPDMTLQAGGLGGNYWTDLSFPVGVKGAAYADSGRLGVAGVGRLISSPLALSSRYASFKLASSGGSDLSAALQAKRTDLLALGLSDIAVPAGDASGWVDLAVVSPPRHSPVMQRVVFDLEGRFGLRASWLREQPLQIRFVLRDGSTRGWLAVDDFGLHQADPRPGLIVARHGGDRVFYDSDTPVWGFADTHAHPVHHLAMGGRLIVGDSEASLAQMYDTRVHDRAHAGPVPGLGLKATSNAGIAIGDPHFAEGAPTLVGYPRFNVGTHQQHHPEFFRRAWQGGQRLMVALAVNNQYLPTRGLGVGRDPNLPIDDHSQVFLQLDAMRRMVSANADFMEIALTPRDARRIVLEGKLAVVLGLELDSFGNFKDESFIWGDPGARSDAERLRALPRDPAAAAPLLRETVEAYRRAGVRQAMATHYVDGLFAGVPVQRLEPSLISRAYTERLFDFADGTGEGIAYNAADDLGVLRAVALGGTDFCPGVERFPDMLPAILAVCTPITLGALTRDFIVAGSLPSTINRQGVTPRGRELYAAMMRAGWLVDSEHLSIRSKDDLLAIAARCDYPVMSSHTDTGALSYRSAGRWPAGDDARWAATNTKSIGNLSHEGQVLDRHLSAIRASGGVAGVIMLPYRKKDAELGVPNDLDGSSKTWAQTYLHALSVTGGRGLGLATDRGGVQFLGPRFGPYAAWPLKEEDYKEAKAARTVQRFSQTKGVVYDRPLGTFHPRLFEFGDVNGREEDAWKALAYVTAFPAADPSAPGWASLPDAESVLPSTPQRTPASSDVAHSERITSFVRGWHARREEDLNHPGFANLSDRPWEEAVFWLFRNHPTASGTCVLRTYGADNRVCALNTDGSLPSDAGPILRLWHELRPVHRAWREMNGSGAPLRRLRTLERDWDYNLDGMAHCGLLPDFLQDLRNVGMSAAQMTPLFLSAEDYILSWEKAERTAASVPVRTGTCFN